MQVSSCYLPTMQVCKSTSFSNFIVTNLSIKFLPNPWPSTIYSISGIVNNLVHYFNLCPLGALPSLLIFRNFPEWDCRAAALHVQVMPAYHCRTIYIQALNLLFLCQLTIVNSLWVHRCRQGERRQLAGVGTWAFLPFIHVTLTLGPIWTWSHI